MLAFLLAGVLVAASGQGDPSQVYDSPQNPPVQSESTGQSASGIGTVVELKGTAFAKSQNGSKRTLSEGDAVYAGEKLETSEGSTIQIELNDESLFTLSQNTQMSVDDFAYVNNSSEANLTASVVKGVFRYVSGKVEKVNPEKVNIEIPSGTIGIRGTIVVGEIDGENCLIALEPEEGDTPHRIVIFNNAGGQRNEIEITKPGFATRIEGRHLAPKPVFELPQADKANFQQKLPLPPKFPKGTMPGSPERYKHLFNPDQMMERRQKEDARRNLKGGDETKNENDPDRNFGKREGNGKRPLKDEGEHKFGPQPPEGPDGKDGLGFEGPDQKPFQNQPKDLRLGAPDNNDGPGQIPGFPQKPFGSFSPGRNSEPQQPGPTGFRGDGMARNFGHQKEPAIEARGGRQTQNQQKDGLNRPQGAAVPRNGPSQKR